MNSWLHPNHARDEQPFNSQYPGWSSTPAGMNQPSPNRREHAVQPPLLTTALSGSQFHHASTPLSSTSLSSPFIHGQSPCVPSPANARSASSSSMTPRHATAYNVPYNPQDWGPQAGGGNGHAQYHQINNVVRVAPRIHTEDSLSPPPPPYSPPNNSNRISPDSFSPSNPDPNFGAAPTVTPPQNPRIEADFDATTGYQRRSVHRPRPLSMVYTNDAGSSQQPLPPPPPPQGNLASRSVSQSRMDNYQGVPYNSAVSHSRSRISMSSYDQGLSSPSLRGGNVLGGPAGQLETPSRPPASRRAASAGAIVGSAGPSRPQSQLRNRSPSNSGWEPGMPLPPPPPGPPPATRSVSVSGSSESSAARTPQGPNRTRARPPPLMGSGLGSIPPTPADWVDEEYINHRPSGENKEPLHVDTSRAMATPERADRPDSGETSRQRTPGSGGLFRSSAVRDPSAKGIRERRIERRNRQSQTFDEMSAVSSSGNPWADALEQIKPSNLILPEPRNSPDHVRQPTSARFTPRSTQSLPSEGNPGADRSRASSGGLFSDHSAHSTPRMEPSPVGRSTAFAHTPPFSPNVESSSAYPKETQQPIPPKALPTPPLNSGKEIPTRLRTPSRGAEDRPISHILHIPNDAVSTIKPLSPRRPPGHQSLQQPSLESVMKQDIHFVQDAMQRHQKFIEDEAAAVDEAEALKIFSQFIISESQIRRERYRGVWGTGSFEVEDVRRKLFEMPASQPALPVSNKPPRPAPTLEIPQNRPSRPESAWWNNYQPCLSPIASLGVSNDEMSSRGRAPSRWWESKTGSSSEGGERRPQRSKRESKYMGLPRDAMNWDQEQTPSRIDDAGSNYTGQHAGYGPDEYPPEKVGWHESPSSVTGNTPRHQSFESKLDISRLITMPPPYPRHYPAVNNSHPDLVSYRTVVRSITDLAEIKSTRQRYEVDVERMSSEHQGQIQEGRRHFKANIQSQIQEGSLTFAEAAEAEAAMLFEEHKGERDLAKRQLDTYQEMVLHPMHAILADRIDRATTCIDELSSKVFDDARRDTPDQTQEEGDQKPELLEKLTQLKWLFEAREQLHREVFELISDRDEKYKTIALLPYQQTKNDEKVRETYAFFAKDSLNRRVQYETEAFARLESFLDVIEQNVVRGVEVQLSAFWDIAPSLLTLVQRVPGDLRGFQVQIPIDEYEESPSYHAHPLQYLYSLLLHAEKSSYQYIESQTNLLCLLHEVRSALMRANRNLTQTERMHRGEPEEVVLQDMQLIRADEELNLTTDLKDKVSTVEGQWTEALGSQIGELRDRVKEQLMAEGGWEDVERLEQE